MLTKLWTDWLASHNERILMNTVLFPPYNSIPKPPPKTNHVDKQKKNAVVMPWYNNRKVHPYNKGQGQN